MTEEQWKALMFGAGGFLFGNVGIWLIYLLYLYLTGASLNG